MMFGRFRQPDALELVKYHVEWQAKLLREQIELLQRQVAEVRAERDAYRERWTQAVSGQGVAPTDILMRQQSAAVATNVVRGEAADVSDDFSGDWTPDDFELWGQWIVSQPYREPETLQRIWVQEHGQKTPVQAFALGID